MPIQTMIHHLTERQIQLLRVDANFRKQILKELNKAETGILVKLMNSGLEAGKEGRLRALLKEVKAVINEVYELIDEKMTDNLNELGSIESLGAARLLNNTVTNISLNLIALPAARIKSIVSDTLINGAPSAEWWERQSIELQRKFSDAMRTGLILGDTNQKLIQRVRGTKAFNFTNGIMETSRNDADALVRTSVQAIANEARVATFDDSDIIESYQHVSTLDSRTTPQCIVRDGLRWDAKTKEPIGHSIPYKVPPIHWRCRSTLIPILKGVDIVGSATRASQDGQVKASVTFESFLEGKSKAFQDELLGTGKAELWRAGKITLRQLLDQTGNPLTLKQLKAKYN